MKLTNSPSVQKNDYYSDTIEEFFAGKDSVIEMAKIINYDKERLVAKVYTINSQQYRDDVPVFFPSMYLNTGIISPPVIGSTSLLYWGPDRQPFLLPVQLTVPSVSVVNGVTKLNASPGLYDEILSLKNIQGGEHLLRSMGGAYLFLKNIGEIELGTSRLHRLTLSEKDGALDLVSQRIRAEVGNARFYFGPASIDSNVDNRTNFFLEIDENSDETSQMPTIDDNTLLDSVMNNKMDTINLVPTPKIFTQQMVHVLGEEGVAETDEVDGTELFSKSELNKNGAIRTETLSKGGRKVIRTSLGGSQTDIIVSPSEVKIVQQRIVDGVNNSTHIGINSTGQIICSQNGAEYDLMPMLKWFYEERV